MRPKLTYIIQSDVYNGIMEIKQKEAGNSEVKAYIEKLNEDLNKAPAELKESIKKKLESVKSGKPVIK